MTTPLVERGYVLVADRKVHYRRFGCGPVVILLHGSPQSSRAVTPLAEFLATQGFCAIAADTPGYGLSEPLPDAASASTQSYAAGVIAFADALGIQRFALYGFHTGATIACTAAACYPARIAALGCDGLPAWTPAERHDILQHYLPPFVPQWDGSHLCWLWARLEEQVIFFPWHSAQESSRMTLDLSPLPALHANAMDLLQADDQYRHAYRAAFTFAAEDWVPQITVPHLYACMAADPLSVHYQRPVYQHSHTALFSSLPAMWQAFSQLFAATPGDTLRHALAGNLKYGTLTAGWAGPLRRALAWCGTLHHPPKQALVLLHAAGDSKAAFQSLLPLISKDRTVIAVDLPGHGDSEPRTAADCPTNTEQFAKEIAEACTAIGLTDYSVAGYGFGAYIAAELVKQGYAKAGLNLGVKAIPAEYRSQWSMLYAADLTAQWDGAHLLRAFRVARWERLYFPWFVRKHSHKLPAIASLEPSSIHQRAVSLLKAGVAWQYAVAAEATAVCLSNQVIRGFSAVETAQNMGNIQLPLAEQAPLAWLTYLKTLA